VGRRVGPHTDPLPPPEFAGRVSQFQLMFAGWNVLETKAAMVFGDVIMRVVKNVNPRAHGTVKDATQ